MQNRRSFLKSTGLVAVSTMVPVNVTCEILKKKRFGMVSFHPDLKIYPEYRVPGSKSGKYLFSGRKDIPKILKAFEGKWENEEFFSLNEGNGSNLIWWQFEEKPIPNSKYYRRVVFSSIEEAKQFYLRKKYTYSKKEINTYYIINLATYEIFNLGEFL